MRKRLLCIALAITTLNAVPVYAKDITVTIPSYLINGEPDLPGTEDAKIQEDGSMVYTLDKSQRKEWKKSLRDSLDNSINEILGDDVNYPNIEEISYNDDMTEFNIRISSSQNMVMSEYFVGYLPLFIAPLYQQADGVAFDDVDYTMITTVSSTGDETKRSYAAIAEDWKNSGFSNSSNTTSSESSSSEQKVDKVSFSSDSSSLEYTGVETMKYDENETLVVLKFNYTNKTSSPSTVTSFYSAKAYQNGVELDWYMGLGNTACDNASKTVLQDTSLEVGYAFMLQDTDNPVTLYMYDGFMSDSPCQIQEISIK